MAVHVLIITPTSGFGELIRETLRDEGQYLPVLVYTGENAIAYATKTNVDLAIIDADLEDVHPASLARSLRKICPNLHLIIFPPESGEGRTAFDDVLPDAFMDKPFYIPDLVETAARILGIDSNQTQNSSQSSGPNPIENISTLNADKRVPDKSTSRAKQPPAVAKPQPSQPPPPWLEDVFKAAQYLTRLSLETAAQAALISRSGKLWASAGQLSQTAANELAIAVTQFWNEESNSDLVRFIRLDATGEELMLYATSLGANLVLALAFEAETPFSKIRAQAGFLARALSTPPAIGVEVGFEPEEILKTQDNFIINQQNNNLPVDLPSINSRSITIQPENNNSDLLSSTKSSDLASAFLDNFPSANNNPHPMLDSFLGDLPSAPKAERGIPTSTPLPNETNSFVDTRTGSNQTSSINDDLQSNSTNGTKLTYTFLMIPRMPEHQLKGDIISRIDEWTSRLCIAFGWQLKHFSIESNYFLWTVSVGPKVSPASINKKFRKHLSRKILAEFPRLAKDNPSDDFWASDYLVYNGIQTLMDQVITDFIAKTRINQGVSQ